MNVIVETGLTAHPAATLFPPMSEEAFEALKADIQENGQLSPIIVIGALILDGCNRNRACSALGIEPWTLEWDGRCGTPLAFVISKNLKRRHLTTSQRSMIAGRLANLEICQTIATATKAADVSKDTSPIVTMTQAAEMLNISRISVVRARAVLRSCPVEEIDAVESGKVSLRRAHKAIKTKTATSIKSGVVSATGKNPHRIDRMRLRNSVWKNVRTALIALTSLPLPEDALRLARQMDRQKLIPQKLPGALAWLKEFANVCDGKAEGAAAEPQHGEGGAGSAGTVTG